MLCHPATSLSAGYALQIRMSHETRDTLARREVVWEFEGTDGMDI